MFNEDNRFGSSRWGQTDQIRRAGLLGDNGPILAYTPDGRHAMRLPTDGHALYIGGVGSGKSAGWYLLNQCGGYLLEPDGEGGNSVDLDVRGDLTAVSTVAATMDGFEQYSFNPTGVPWAPQHRCNPWDDLTLDSPSLIADNRDKFVNLLPLSVNSGGKVKWWEADAQEWGSQLNLSLVERDGSTTMTKFYRLINTVEGDLGAWCDHLEFMGSSRFLEVRRCGQAIMDKQKEWREGFTAPMSTLYTTLNFMQDTRIQDALDGSDFSMGDVVDDNRRVRIKLIIPIEHLRQWAPAIRSLIASSIIQKLRRPGARRLTFQIDECGQLGAFPAIRQLYSFGRGAGCRALCAWQSTGQIMEAFGFEGFQEIMNSAQVRMFKGVRDIATAGVVSRMVGKQTLQLAAGRGQAAKAPGGAAHDERGRPLRDRPRNAPLSKRLGAPHQAGTGPDYGIRGPEPAKR